jgi:hypothetical protein
MTQRLRVMLLVAPVMTQQGRARRGEQQMSLGSGAVLAAGARLHWILRRCSCRCVCSAIRKGVLND